MLSEKLLELVAQYKLSARDPTNLNDILHAVLPAPVSTCRLVRTVADPVLLFHC